MRSFMIRCFMLVGWLLPALVHAGASCQFSSFCIYFGYGDDSCPGSRVVTSCPTTDLLGTCTDSDVHYPSKTYWYGTDPTGYLEQQCQSDGDAWAAGNAASQTTQTQISNARFFAYAEGVLPGDFPLPYSAGQSGPYNYRYYSASKNYLAVDTNEDVWVLGPFSRNMQTNYGPVSAFAAAITQWEGSQAGTTATTCTSSQVLQNGVCVTPSPATSNPTGQLAIWTSNQYGVAQVYIDNENVGSLTSYYTGQPDCGASGTVTKTLSAGSHTVKGTNNNTNWGPMGVTVQTGRCTLLELQGSQSGSSGGATGGGSSGSGSSSGGSSGGGTSGGGTSGGGTSGGGTSGDSAREAALACKNNPYLYGANDPQVDNHCKLVQFDGCLHRAGYPQYDNEAGSYCQIIDAMVQQVGTAWSCRYCATYPYEP